MNKKFLSVILFGALLVGSAGTFTSCKDYDDDIKDLQGQLDKKASLDELNSKVTALEASIAGAKTDATAAKTAAEDALKKAQEALDNAGQGGSSSAEVEALKAALEKAQADLQAQINKLASLEDVTAKVAELKNELQADFVTDEKLQALSTKVNDLTAEVIKLIGHRLTSMAVIPTTHINGIAAITFTTLQYTPQVYRVVADHNPNEHATSPVLDHVGVGSTRYISTEKNKAYYNVSPSLGVRKQDIKLPIFDGLKSENIITRADGVAITANKPIEVTDYNITEGILEVTFKKEKSFLETQLKTSNPTGSKESFYMASLRAPISEENYTATEATDLENGTIDGVYVNSEYARIEEMIKLPYLANSRTNYGKATTGEFANETQSDANGEFYVHYHDSICLYKSDANSLIDVYQPYDQTLDLKKLVEVCVSDINNDHSKHEELVNYADYGLAFRFRLANAPYTPESDNTNKTDQQKFAEIDSPENGIMKSKVYGISESATAVGREPIVCVTLIDTKNGNAMIAQRYIKVKWTMEGKTLPVAFQPRLFDCEVVSRVDTEMMNTLIYDKAKAGGMTKNEFHSIYTVFEEVAGGAGTAKDIANPEEGVESHNILWTLSTTDLGVFWPGQQEKTFTKTVLYKDPKGINADIKVVLTRTIYMPALNVWGHMGTYWKGDKEYKIFNINPIVYGTKENNPAWNEVDGTNPTCNIYTDLLNGFLDDRYMKPTLGAAGVVYYTDKNVANTRFYYPDFAPTLAGATMKANANGIYYELEGVRFVFDKARIANYKYTWKDGKEYTATLRNNDTELWINGQKAATIENYVDNRLNPDEKTYNIKLEEVKPDHPVTDYDNQPTEAAKALVGKLVPINLVADLCNNGKNVATVKSYEANIIEPLQVKKGEIKNFIDAQNEGSTIDVTGAFTYYSWNDNNQVVAKTGKDDLAEKLYYFYQVREAAWPLTAGSTEILDVTKIKTNLKGEGGNLEPSEGYTEGKLPANVEIRYEKKDINNDGTLEEVLTYYNYSGTPVNKAYKLYIPVEYGYKWKTLTNVYEVTVAPNSGTPGN